jgi:hypothetical protein
MRRDTYIAALIGFLGAASRWLFFGLDRKSGNMGMTCGSSTSSAAGYDSVNRNATHTAAGRSARDPNVADKRLDCASIKQNRTILAMERGTVNMKEESLSFQYVMPPVTLPPNYADDPRYATFLKSHDATPVFEIFLETLRRYPDAVFVDLHYEQFGAPFALAAAQRGHETMVATKHEEALCSNLKTNAEKEGDLSKHITIFPDPTYIVEYIEYEVRVRSFDRGESKPPPLILKLQECHFLEGAIWPRYDYDTVLVICPVVLNVQFIKREDLPAYAYNHTTSKWRRWLGTSGAETAYEGVVYAVSQFVREI